MSSKSTQKQTGFTLVEMMVALMIVSVLFVLALPVHNTRTAKSQVTEAMMIFDSERQAMIAKILRYNACKLSTDTNSTSKFGTLSVSGSVTAASISNPRRLRKTGCVMTFTFGNNATRLIRNRTLVVDLFNNGALSRSSSSTMDVRYAPVTLKQITEDP